MGAWRGKRIFDLVGSAAALQVVAFPALGIAVAIRLTMGAPVLFRQRRAGLNGRPFSIYKFRTMTAERDENGDLLPDDQRLTAVGRFLRSNSLDEIPQLLNVLKGEMSLVGPRPFYVRYLDRYTPEQARRHEVKPGITGWNQVNGRTAIDWDKKIALDLEYVDRQSLLFDLRILLATLWIVVSRKGLREAVGEVEPEFTGSAQWAEDEMPSDDVTGGV